MSESRMKPRIVMAIVVGGFVFLSCAFLGMPVIGRSLALGLCGLLTYAVVFLIGWAVLRGTAWILFIVAEALLVSLSFAVTCLLHRQISCLVFSIGQWLKSGT